MHLGGVTRPKNPIREGTLTAQPSQLLKGGVGSVDLEGKGEADHDEYRDKDYSGEDHPTLEKGQVPIRILLSPSEGVRKNCHP